MIPSSINAAYFSISSLTRARLSVNSAANRRDSSAIARFSWPCRRMVVQFHLTSFGLAQGRHQTITELSSDLRVQFRSTVHVVEHDFQILSRGSRIGGHHATGILSFFSTSA